MMSGVRRDAAHIEAVDADDVSGPIPSPCSLSLSYCITVLHNAHRPFSSTPYLKFQLATTSTINNKEMDHLTTLPLHRARDEEDQQDEEGQTRHAKDRQQEVTLNAPLHPSSKEK